MTIKRTIYAAICMLAASPAVSHEFGSLGGAYIGPMQSQVGGLVENATATIAFQTANNGWCARVLAVDTKDFKSVAVNFSAATTPGTATLRIETIDMATGKPSGTLYDAAATKSFTPAVGWNVVTFDVLPTTGTTAGTPYAIVLIKDDTSGTVTLRSSFNGGNGNYPTIALTATDGSSRSAFAEVANNTPVCYFIMEDDSYTSMGCMSGVSSGIMQFDSADDCAGWKIVLAKDISVKGVRFYATSGIYRGGTPTVDLRFRILDSSNVAVSGSTVTIDKDLLTGVGDSGMYIPFAPITLAAGTYRAVFDSAGNASHRFGLNYATIADANLISTGFSYTESNNMTSTFTWTDTPTRILPFGLELDSIPADEGGGGTDQITVVPFYGQDIQQDTGTYPFEFGVYRNGIPFALDSGAVQGSLNGGTDSASGLTLNTISTGRYEVVIDSDNAAFNAGGNLSLFLSSGTVDGDSIVGAKVGEVSIDRYATAPANFDSLSVDGDGRVDVIKIAGTTQTARDIGASVLLSPGTGTGQLSITSGVVQSDMRQVLGTALTDVGSGDFGSTLAGNFSILFGQANNESNTAIGASEINNILTRTNRIPNIAAGSSGGILIAGSNAATTFSTLTSTGALSINGTSMVAQTGDSFARIGAPAGASVSADIADLPTVTELNAGIASLPQTGDLATPAEINTEIEAGQVGTDTAAIVAKLPTAGAKMAGEGATAKNLDQVEADAGSIDRAGADMIAARVNASRGEFYPNRNQVWVLRRTDGGVTVKNDFEITKKAGESLKVWVDFAGILGRNEAVESIESIDVDGGTATIVVDSEEIVGNLVAVTITGGAADDVTTLQLEVLTTEDQTITVDACTMNVVE